MNAKEFDRDMAERLYGDRRASPPELLKLRSHLRILEAVMECHADAQHEYAASCLLHGETPPAPSAQTLEIDAMKYVVAKWLPRLDDALAGLPETTEETN